MSPMGSETAMLKKTREDVIEQLNNYKFHNFSYSSNSVARIPVTHNWIGFIIIAALWPFKNSVM